jgi:hypothetical protein
MGWLLLVVCALVFCPPAQGQEELDHFEWESVGTNLAAGLAFPVTVSARDNEGQLLSGFSGSAQLSGIVGEVIANQKILGSPEHDSANVSWIPSFFGGYTAGYAFTPSVAITITHVRHYYGSKVSIWTDTGALLGSQDVVSSSDSWTATEWSVPVELEAGVRYVVGVCDLESAYYEPAEFPLDFAHGSIDKGCTAYGDAYPSLVNSSALYFVDLGYLVDGEEELSMTPTNAVELIDGVWSGEVTVLEGATNMVLRAGDASGPSGDSNPFDVRPYLLSLRLPPGISEGEAAVSAQVVANYPLDTALPVVLSTDSTNELILPAGVTLPAGQTNILFDLEVIDDALLDGSRSAAIFVAASNGLSSSAGSLFVHDNESAALTLSLPLLTHEGAGTVSGSVWSDVAPDVDVTVSLLSGNEGEIGSGSVILPAGHTNASFELPVLDDLEIDDVQTAIVTAHVENWQGAQAAVSVQDNEISSLHLTLPEGVFEGQGTLTNAAMVYLDGAVSVDLNITLQSSDTTEARVAETVTIPAGESNVYFNVTAVEDDEADGRQYPMVSAASAGFNTCSSVMGVGDNEFTGFSVSTPDESIPGYVPVQVAITTVNIDDEPVICSSAGSAQVSATVSNLAVVVDLSGPVVFANGVWHGFMVINGAGDEAELRVDDGAGHATTTVLNLYPLNVVKMEPDYALPYVYLLHTGADAAEESKLLWYNTQSGAVELSAPAGTNASDLAVDYLDERLYVSTLGVANVAVFDRPTQTRISDLLLNKYIYRISSGPTGRFVTENDYNHNYSSYYTVVDIRDSESGSSEASTSQNTLGPGTGESDTLGRYYYHADGTASFYSDDLRKYDISSGALDLVGKVEITLSARRELVISGDGSRLFWNGSVYDSDLNLISDLGEAIYASSLHGQLAVTQTNVLDAFTGAPVYTLPFASDAMAFYADQSELLLFDPASHRLAAIPTASLMSDSVPTLLPSPAPDSTATVSLPELSWSEAPLGVAYEVYLGTDSNAVAAADTNSAVYFGRVTEPALLLADWTLEGSQSYYWRVDTITYDGNLLPGELWHFDTWALSLGALELEISALAAGYTQRVSVALSSAVSGEVSWTAGGTNSWLRFAAEGGTTPDELECIIDVSQLTVGEHSAVIEISDGVRTYELPLSVDVLAMNIVKMATDWQRPYIYMVHTAEASPYPSMLICYNTDTRQIDAVLEAGENATDLTVHYGDDRIYVNNYKREETRVFDRSTQLELDPLLLGEEVYLVNAGRKGRLLVEDGDHGYQGIYDTTTGEELAFLYAGWNGDGEASLDGCSYYHIDFGDFSARVRKYDVSTDAHVQVLATKPDDYSGYRKILVSMDGRRVCYSKSVYDEDLQRLILIGSKIDAVSAYGDLVVAGSKAYDSESGEVLGSLPFTSKMMAFAGDQSTLVLFNATDGSLTAVETADYMALPEPGLAPELVAGDVVSANLSELCWTPAPVALAYDVYLGVDSKAVATATTNSAVYLGREASCRFALDPGQLAGSTTYYWRVDARSYGDAVTTGEVWSFRTAAIAAAPESLVLQAVEANYTQTVAFAVDAASTPSIRWTASCAADWVQLAATHGSAPGSLDVGFDMTGLEAGSYATEIAFCDGTVTQRIPVALEVETMRIMKMATDWEKPYVYMIHTMEDTPNSSSLIWYNTQTEAIEQVLDAGENATDLTVHYDDDRIYVNNYDRYATRVFCRSTMQELDPLMLGQDVYKINAAGAGRLITEGESRGQWMWETAGGTQLWASAYSSEGDGEGTRNGLYYYHADYGSSGALIRKYDISSTEYTQITSVAPQYTSGARNILLSRDGDYVVNHRTVYDADLVELQNLGTEIYTLSGDGSAAVTAAAIMDSYTGETVYTLPFSAPKSAFSSDQQRLVLYNWSEHSLITVDTSGFMAMLYESTEYENWQARYFPDGGGADSADADLDGVCNRDEYIAGTDPTSRNSCFAVDDAVLLTEGGMELYWSAVTNRVYSIYWTPSLSSPFEMLESGLVYPQDSYTDQVERGELTGFYMLGVELE